MTRKKARRQDVCKERRVAVYLEGKQEGMMSKENLKIGCQDGKEESRIDRKKE